MDNANLWLAIKARAATDTGAGGLFYSTPLVTGIYPNTFPEDQKFPWIVFDIADVTQYHAFAKDVFGFTVYFNVYVPRESESISDPYQTASNIIGRLYGDSSAGSAPTYGFHRHKLVPSGSWTGGYMLKTGAFVSHEDTILHFTEQYSMHVSK